MTVELRSRQAAAGIFAAVAQVEPRVLPIQRRLWGRRAFMALILAIVTPPAGVALVNAIRDDDPRTNLRIVDDARRKDDGDRVQPREPTTDEEAASRPGGALTGGEPRQAGRIRTAPTVASLGLTGRLAFTATDEPVGACEPNGDCVSQGRTDIRIMDLRTGRVTQLISSQLFEDGARWSPDGSRLAYSLSQGDPTKEPGLYTIRADGSDNRRIASGSRPTWSPDGRRIAFVVEPLHENVCVGGTQERPECGVQEMPEQQEIWMVDADGTDLHRVEEIPSNENPREPAWSPDGRYLAFVQGAYGEPAVYVLDFQTKQIDWIRSGSNPAWAPDGKRLAIADDYLVEVIAMPSGEVIERINGWGPSLSEPAWSPDGEWIAFTEGSSSSASEGARRSIWVARPNGTGMKVVLEGGAEDYGAPSWTVAP